MPLRTEDVSVPHLRSSASFACLKCADEYREMTLAILYDSVFGLSEIVTAGNYTREAEDWQKAILATFRKHERTWKERICPHKDADAVSAAVE